MFRDRPRIQRWSRVKPKRTKSHTHSTQNIDKIQYSFSPAPAHNTFTRARCFSLPSLARTSKRRELSRSTLTTNTEDKHLKKRVLCTTNGTRDRRDLVVSKVKGQSKERFLYSFTCSGRRNILFPKWRDWPPHPCRAFSRKKEIVWGKEGENGKRDNLGRPFAGRLYAA